MSLALFLFLPINAFAQSPVATGSIGSASTTNRASADCAATPNVLDWTTASELNTAGFNLYRSENANGPFIKINAQLIPASPDPLTGGKYEYLDKDVVAGHTYYYQLEDVEVSGASARHPSQAVTAAAAFPICANSNLLPIAGVGALLAFAALLVLRARTRNARDLFALAREHITHAEQRFQITRLAWVRLDLDPHAPHQSFQQGLVGDLIVIPPHAFD